VLFPDHYNNERARNKRHLMITELGQQPVLVSLNESVPLLELYSPEGTLLVSKDLSKHPLLPNILAIQAKLYEEAPQDRATSLAIFPDATVVDDILIFGLYGREPPYSILRLRLTLNSIEWLDVLKVDPPPYYLAYDGGERLFLYDRSNSSVKRYRIPAP